MKKIYISLFLVTLCNSCSSPQKEKHSKIETDVVVAGASIHKIQEMDIFKVSGDSVTILPFEIEIELSPKAQDKIKNNHETIIVDVSCTGIPKDSAAAKFQEDGSFFVTRSMREIYYGQIARFTDFRFSKNIYDQLADKDIDLSVNVYSGRKSSSENLLDCEPLFDKISNVVNKKFTLKGKLIYGDD